MNKIIAELDTHNGSFGNKNLLLNHLIVVQI